MHWIFRIILGTDGFDNSVYQQQTKHHGKTLRIRENNQWSSHKPRPRFSSSTSSQNRGHHQLSEGSNQRRHKKVHHRPTFGGPIENVTVNVGREATLECLVNHLDKYKVITYKIFVYYLNFNSTF